MSTSRLNYLNLISGLNVIEKFDKTKNSTYYEFVLNNCVVHACYTYGKAKQYAMGIDMGRKLHGK